MTCFREVWFICIFCGVALQCLHYLVKLLRLNVHFPRSSRQSPSVSPGSTSTSYKTSINKSQLLNKVPNFSETMADEELNYKVWADLRRFHLFS